ncbi:MAG TPA: argininosuccinate lyase [Candidatus Saccharimonadia bacterium]|nr:argininosuccinate lyase [Candidatus Saccharimonadia bacterium]
MKKRLVLLAALLGATLPGCGYKGDLVAPDPPQDEKAGQVDPEPIPSDEPPG